MLCDNICQRIKLSDVVELSTQDTKPEQFKQATFGQFDPSQPGPHLLKEAQPTDVQKATMFL